MIEQAIYNEAHERNLIVPDKRKDHDEDTTPAAGAYVAEPKKGLHEWIGLVDIQSMYPSSIRALNMAPETIIGQVRQTLTDAFIRQRGVDRANSMSRRKNTEDDEVTGSFVWEGIFACLEYTAIMNRELGTLLTIDFENGTSKEMSAAEIHDMIFDSHRPWVISANGTIFTLEKEGVIPGLLTRWFSDRISMRSKMAKLDKLNTGIEVPPELYEKLNRLIP
jgi:DNA polymerase elongation subunit (family B)